MNGVSSLNGVVVPAAKLQPGSTLQSAKRAPDGHFFQKNVGAGSSRGQTFFMVSPSHISPFFTTH